jgi:transketolase
MPGILVIRPADANETAQAWAAALAYEGPSAIILSRQGLPILDPKLVDVAKGAAIVAAGDEATIVATGSEVEVALAARDLLAKKNVATRVVSMPSMELFRERPAEEQDKILPYDVPVVAVEAASPFGWHEFADDVVGLSRFGASAPAPLLYEKLGITAQAVAERVMELLDRE